MQGRQKQQPQRPLPALAGDAIRRDGRDNAEDRREQDNVKPLENLTAGL